MQVLAEGSDLMTGYGGNVRLQAALPWVNPHQIAAQRALCFRLLPSAFERGKVHGEFSQLI